MDVSSTNRRVYIIDDLLGAILMLAAAALAVLLDLTRRQICAVYQLAFALCAACTFFIVGGLVDHHLSNEQINLALYGSYLSGPLTTSYIYLPTLASLGISVAFLFSLSACNCDCCCLVGVSATSHQRCLVAKLRANTSLYGGCFAWLFVAIGTRINVRLRESAINPVGGTVHWMMLRSPLFLAMAHVGSLLLVALKLFLQHADRPTHSFSSPRPSMTESLSQADSHSASPSMVDELMRPPPIKNFALAPRRTSDTKQSRPRSPQTAAAAITIKSDATQSPRSTTAAAKLPPRRYSGNNSEPQNDGDVSSLISSDSDSDDSVLRPRKPTTKALPPRHTTAGRTRPSGYASSPPPSPTHSTTSTGSSSTHSSSRLPRASASRPSSSSSVSTRPRLTSSASSSSTTFLSDNDDHLLSTLEAYGSSGTEGAGSYLSDQPSRGIRRRAPSINTPASLRRRPTPVPAAAPTPTEWIECVDEATGSAYYYNTSTGESRWKEQ